MEENVKRLKILMEGKELTLAVEERNTNIRIWVHHEKDDKNHLYFRLDKYQAYSCPLAHGIGYLNQDNKAITELNNRFEFGQVVSIACMNEIIDITSKLKQRKLKDW